MPCHTEFPDIIKLQNAYKGKGLQVVEVSMNDVTDKDELQKYLSETKPPFTVYIAANTEDQFYKDMDPRWDTALPMTMIFDRDGKNVAFYKEARTYDQFDKDVAPLLALRNNVERMSFRKHLRKSARRGARSGRRVLF